MGGLLRVVCDATGLKSGNVGRIDIMASFSFFDTDNEHVDKVLKKLNGAQFEGHNISVEVSSGGKGGGASAKRSGGDRKFGGGGDRKFGGGDRKFSGERKGSSGRDRKSNSSSKEFSKKRR